MKRREYYEEQKLKKLVYVFSITLIISIAAFLAIFVMYNKKLRLQSSDSLLGLSHMNDIVSNDELKEASFSDDLSVASTTNSIQDNKSLANTSNIIKKNVESKVPVEAQVDTSNTISNSISETNNTVSQEEAEEKELSFMAPVSGEILKDFAMDTLIYSKTLEEWTTHSGIDIKADKTTVVAAAEEGTVESIKNDPRYGLTITISHRDGFKTIYSNLLTTEFVSENEKVEKGQTIATIGDTSSFEVADESHLHFEMYKDGVVVNPTIYLK